MPMSSDTDGYPIVRYFGYAVLAVIVGLPLLLLLAFCTQGAILAPLLGVLFITPFILGTYLVGKGIFLALSGPVALSDFLTRPNQNLKI